MAEPALGQYDEARAMLWTILVTYGELERAYGDDAAADRLHDRARGTVSYIADLAGKTGMRYLRNLPWRSCLDKPSRIGLIPNLRVVALRWEQGLVNLLQNLFG